jgi:predicted small lipoprotein YifL
MKALRSLGLAALLAAPLAACGDDGGSTNPPDAMPIDAPPETTFTSYVLDLVQHQTAGDTDPRPFAEFSDLTDPDRDNDNAYEALFP